MTESAWVTMAKKSRKTGSHVRLPGDLRANRLKYIAETLMEHMYLEIEPTRDGKTEVFLNPDKDVDGADLIQALATLLATQGLHPESRQRIG